MLGSGSVQPLLFPGHFRCILVPMHCSCDGHDRAEMYVLDECAEAGSLVYKCPVCGRSERLVGRASNVQVERIGPPEELRAAAPLTDPPPVPILPDVTLGATLDAIGRWWDGGAGVRSCINSIREWWDGGEWLVAFLETSSEEDHPGGRPVIPVRPKLIRKSVSLDHDRAELRVGEGPPIPFSDAQVFVFRHRRVQGETGWRGTSSQRLEDGPMWTFEVFVRCGDRKFIVAEFGTRSGAEKCAKELREELSCAGDYDL